MGRRLWFKLVERLVSDRKVGDSGFDSHTDNANLCLWERNFTLFSIEAKLSIRCGGPA